MGRRVIIWTWKRRTKIAHSRPIDGDFCPVFSGAKIGRAERSSGETVSAKAGDRARPALREKPNVIDLSPFVHHAAMQNLR
jgi:hypothetical protein